MNLFEKCVCVLLLTVFLGGNGVHSVCQQSDLDFCSDPIRSLNASSRLNLDVVCPLEPKISACQEDFAQVCLPGGVPVAFKKEAEFSKALCNFHNNPDPSYSCSGKEILRCSNDVYDMSSQEKANKNVVCTALLKISSCQLKQTMSCPEDVKNSFKAFYDSTEQLRKECSGVGLKSNVVVLLTAAILVVVRQFL